MKSIHLYGFVFCLILSCQTETKKKELEIKESFSKMSPETQDFFNRDTKLRCSCLKEYASELESVFSTEIELLEELKKKNFSGETNSKIINKFLPVYAMYTECMSDAPGPSESVELKIQEDLKKFSGASVPGGKSFGIMETLSNLLIELHCVEYKALVLKTNSWLLDMGVFMKEMSGIEIETDQLKVHSE